MFFCILRTWWFRLNISFLWQCIYGSIHTTWYGTTVYRGRYTNKINKNQTGLIKFFFRNDQLIDLCMLRLTHIEHIQAIYQYILFSIKINKGNKFQLIRQATHFSHRYIAHNISVIKSWIAYDCNSAMVIAILYAKSPKYIYIFLWFR